MRKTSSNNTNIIRIVIVFITSMIMLISQGFTQSKSSDMTNDAIGRMPSMAGVENPADYFRDRAIAISHSRNRQWDEALPILEKLTGMYQDDGDTWYLLGLSYFQQEKWRKAIASLENAIELGVAVSGIPTGSRPSNDIMIKIAKAYSHMGKVTEAISWINKALDARYDDRIRLAGDKDFEKINSTEEFSIVSGEFFDNELSRDELWRADLDFLVSEATRLHVDIFHKVSSEDFYNKVAKIREEIPTLTDKKIMLKFMELSGMLGNGHNFILPTNAKRGNFSQIPLQFYWFKDGLYVVDGNEEYKTFVGYKVKLVGTTAIEEVLERLKSINARDNEMQHLWLSPYYLSLPTVLEGLGVIENADSVQLTLIDNNGNQHTIVPTLKPLSFNGFPKLPARLESAGLHNLRDDKNYWYGYTEDRKSIYVQFNSVQQSKDQSLEAFNIELRDTIDASEIENIILDIRHNSGGNGSILPPMLKTLINFEVTNPDGKIFVVIGRNTYSAAHTLLAWLSQFTDAIFVGEPSGSRPNALSESGWYRLPYSGIMGIFSSQFHQSSRAEDHRIWVAPHVPVSLSSVDYFDGNDPALNAINEIIEAERHN